MQIHVFGGSKGESIVLELPNGAWGVVDYYTPRASGDDAHPVIAFLESQGVQTLEFVCLTHPHNDHFRGILALMERFPVAEFWRPPAMDRKLMAKIVALYATRSRSDPTDQTRQDAKELGELYVRLYDTTLTNQRPALRPRASVENTELYRNDASSLRILALSPSGRSLMEYERLLCNSIDENGNMRSHFPHARHNAISMSLWIEYGETKFVLGGDVESEGWTDVLNDQLSPLNRADGTHYVKVSHHGSQNGFCTGLWEKFSQSGHPRSVLTPFSQHRLPVDEAVDHIRKHSRNGEIWCPDIQAAKRDRVVPFSTRAPVRSRQMVFAKLKARPLSAENRLGRVSMQFDEKGECIGTNCSKGAGPL